MFTMHIWRQGGTEAITWDDGRLEGSAFLTRRLRNEALYMSGEAVKPGGKPATHAEHLQDPLSTLLLARRIWKVVKVEGDVPTWPQGMGGRG